MKNTLSKYNTNTRFVEYVTNTKANTQGVKITMDKIMKKVPYFVKDKYFF